jgi:hypothetical protein
MCQSKDEVRQERESIALYACDEANKYSFHLVLDASPRVSSATHDRLDELLTTAIGRTLESHSFRPSDTIHAATCHLRVDTGLLEVSPRRAKVEVCVPPPTSIFALPSR